MDNIVQPNFKQNQLHDLAVKILELCQEEAENRHISVPEVIGTLELCKSHVIREAVEDELDDDA